MLIWKLIARRWMGIRSYKNDAAKGQTSSRQAAREEIIHGLRSADAKTHFGFDVHFNDQYEDAFVLDGSGD
jgi:hypothetical protein